MAEPCAKQQQDLEKAREEIKDALEDWSDALGDFGVSVGATAFTCGVSGTIGVLTLDSEALAACVAAFATSAYLDFKAKLKFWSFAFEVVKGADAAEKLEKCKADHKIDK